MEIMFSVRKKEQEMMIDSRNNVEKNDHNSSFSSFYEDDDEISSNSMDSSSSSDTTEDASSASSSFEMSSLISQLPLKRGLSKHYEGRSQSFTSLSSVKSLEDLVKPGKSSTRKKQQLKESKSFVWNFDKSKVIKKKSSKGTLSSLSNMRNQGSSLERSQGASLRMSSCLLQGIWKPLVEN